MTNEWLYDRLIKAVDATINGWQGADRLTDLEQRAHAQNIIYGIVKAALYVLPEDKYHELVSYIHSKGFNH